MKFRNSTLLLWGALAIAFGYAGVLSSLPIYQLKDAVNYLRYATCPEAILQGYVSQGVLAVLANEPIWLLINIFFAKYFEPEYVIRTIIFISAFLVAFSSIKHNRKYFIWVMLFLILPQVIKNHIVHLRQGMAVAIFITGWYAVNQKMKWLLMGLTPFIHASFAFVLVLYFLSLLIKEMRLATDLRTLCFIAITVAISLSLGWLASIVGARQATEYTFSHADISGLGFIFWAGILYLMHMQGKKFLLKYMFEISGLIFYLISYWFIPVTARIFESMLLLILVAGLQLTAWRRQVFLVAISIYCLLQYALRCNQPLFGFGV